MIIKSASNNIRSGFFISFYLFFSISSIGQFSLNKFLTPSSDSFNKKRTILGSAFTLTSYSAFSLGIYHAWYKKNNLVSFHRFNDLKEWNQMDKCGHIYDAYFQSDLCFQGAQWAGLSNKKSIVLGISIAQLFLSTIEVYDGFSKQWGFSLPDLTSNFIGSGLFLSQQYFWGEQKVYLKFSAFPISQPKEENIQTRIKELYGNNLAEKLLKNYNTQTYWISFNPSLFIKKSKWPSFINLALGYGSSNLYGGFKNEWTNEKGEIITLNSNQFPRTRDFYLSLDLDWRKLNIDNAFIKTAFRILNVIKFPAPSLSYHSNNKLKFHFIYF